MSESMRYALARICCYAIVVAVVVALSTSLAILLLEAQRLPDTNLQASHRETNGIDDRRRLASLVSDLDERRMRRDVVKKVVKKTKKKVKKKLKKLAHAAKSKLQAAAHTAATHTGR